MSAAHTYSAGGMAQRLLLMLEQGPARFADFRDTYAEKGRRRKAWFLVGAMIRDGLVSRVAPETYEITNDGKEALHELRLGQDVVIATQAIEYAA